MASATQQLTPDSCTILIPMSHPRKQLLRSRTSLLRVTLSLLLFFGSLSSVSAWGIFGGNNGGSGKQQKQKQPQPPTAQAAPFDPVQNGKPPKNGPLAPPSSTNQPQQPQRTTKNPPTRWMVAGSWFQIPHLKTLFSQLPQPIQNLLALSRSILLYKPPVGATSVYVVARLLALRRRRSKSLQVALSAKSDAEWRVRRSKSERRRRRRQGRSLDLDASDRLYDSAGGVEGTRLEVCRSALRGILSREKNELTAAAAQQDNNLNKRNTNDGNAKKRKQCAAAALTALSISCPPRGSREGFVEALVVPFLHLKGLLGRDFVSRRKPSVSLPPSPLPPDAGETAVTASAATTAESTSRIQRGVVPSEADAILLWQASKITEIRMLDATLRILRDRLVLTARRVEKEMKRNARRIRHYQRWGIVRRALYRWYSKVIRRGATLQDDRRKLAITEALYKAELERLGRVQKALLTRPAEMSSTTLLSVSSVASFRGKDPNETHGDTGKSTTTLSLSSSAADAATLLAKDEDGWCDEAYEWTGKARGIICDVVTDKMYMFGSRTSPDEDRNTTIQEDIALVHAWSKEGHDGVAVRADGDDSVGMKGWAAALSLVDELSMPRRFSDGELLLDVIDWFQQFDFYGIPSSLVAIAAANVIHDTVKPYWPKIVDAGEAFYEAIKGIIIFRFWRPFKDIMLDLLNKRPHLMDPYALVDAQTSLDNMLRDLGIGDGTPEMQNEAIAAASRMYEQELKEGPLKRVFRGNLVRLMLVQIQQLKAGLLQAMGTIDELVDANRLNVQLLTAIPAFLLLAVGGRLFVVSLYSLRSRDIRPMKDVHVEMAEMLRRMERTLLLAGHERDALVAASDEIEGEGTPDDGGRPRSQMKGGSAEELNASATSAAATAAAMAAGGTVLRPAELGEFVLLLHSYLKLLDFICSPFSTRICDSIHKGLQDLLLQGQLSTARQISLLKLIETKQLELEKSR